MSSPEDRASGHDWSSRHFTNWFKWTREFAGKPDVRVLEIGSFEGMSAVWWMENVCTHETSRLTCVDNWAWTDYPDARFLFGCRIQKWKDRVDVYDTISRHALAKLPDDTFDLIYVDGSHEGRDACLDVLMSVPLLKLPYEPNVPGVQISDTPEGVADTSRPGGILVMDDYDWHAEGLVDQPHTGYDAALKMNCDRMQVFHCEYQLAARRIR